MPDREEADFAKGGTGENEGVGLEMKEKQMISIPLSSPN